MDVTSANEESIGNAIDELCARFELHRARAVDREVRNACDASPTGWHIDQMHRLCVLYAHFSRPVDGYAVAGAAVRSSRVLKDDNRLRRSLTARGALRRMAGDINGAIEDNVEAYEVARTLGDPALLLSPLGNLIFALGLIDLDDLALRLAEPALDLLPKDPRTFAQVDIATCLMLNVSDLLLWRAPGRAFRLASKAEDILSKGEVSLTAAQHIELSVRLAGARINQVVAAVNLRSSSRARQAVERLRCLLGPGASPRVQRGAAVALAAYDAQFGDQARGLGELCGIAKSGENDSALDASRRLIEFYDLNDHPNRAADALAALQARLQLIRRTVGLEELRRIDGIDQTEVEMLEPSTKKRLARFCNAAGQLDLRLSAKLEHLERIAVGAELREGMEMNRAQHIYRVGKLCSDLAAEAGCDDELQRLAEIAGRLHDIGKCAVPDTTIRSTAPLSDVMREMLREHAEYGARLIADADEPRLIQVVAAVRHHHERFDGSGYPSKLVGTDIPLLARIVALSESFDAMLQSRSYRGCRTIGGALEEIERCAGTHFDPTLAGLFVRLVRRIQRERGDVQQYLGQHARAISTVRMFERLEEQTADLRASL